MSVAPALAVKTRPLITSFGSPGSGAGEMSLVVPDGKVAIYGSGVAVDSTTHDVYVADTENHRVDEFESDGAFVRAWGWGVLNGLPELQTCTSGSGCEKGIETDFPGGFESPAFVAVDNSTGASKGDVYVGDRGDDLVTKFNAEGKLEKGWGTEGQLNGSTTKAKSGLFGVLAGVAVGATGTGTLYVLSKSNEVFEIFGFAQDGTFISPEFEVPRGSDRSGLAVDTGGEFFKVNGDESVEEITATGGDVGQVTPNEEAGAIATGVATEGTDLYVAEAGAVKYYAFSAPGVVSEPGGGSCTVAPGTPCEPSESFGSETLKGGSGIGVDPSTGDVYVADATTGSVDVFTAASEIVPQASTEPASEVTETSIALHGEVSPEGEPVTECDFEYGTTSSYAHKQECEQTPAEINAKAAEHEPVAVSVKLAGLPPAGVRHFRLVAANANPYSTVFGHDLTVNRPEVVSESVSEVTNSSAKLEASVTPQGLDSTYHFSYGPTTACGSEECSVPIPDIDIGSGTSEVKVSQLVQGLSAGTVYHYRVVPGNGLGSEPGPEQTFTTQGAGGFVLPDNRQYEMVSPADKHGASIEAINSGDEEGPIQAAANGDAFTYFTKGTTEPEPAGYVAQVQVLSTRVGGTSSSPWSSRDLDIPHSTPVGVRGQYEGEEYVVFSTDLSLAVVQPQGAFTPCTNSEGKPQPCLSQAASEQTAFLRTNFYNGNVGEPCTSACYRPLVTGCPSQAEEEKGKPCPAAVKEIADVPPGTHFGEEGECPVGKNGNPKYYCGPQFTNATPDLSTIDVGDSVIGGQWCAGKLMASCPEAVPAPRVRKGELESEDGGWVYSIGGEGLQVSHDGTTKSIAPLSAEDGSHWTATNGQFIALRTYTERVSPDGRWLAFMSQESLTGYDNRDAVSGKPDEEVYLYHAPEDLATESGSLICASCNPTGARPHGIEYGKGNLHLPGEAPGLADSLAAAFEDWEPTTWLAANVPGWNDACNESYPDCYYQPRYLSDSGRLFFDSSDNLVPRDVNRNENVYEYEPEGVGNCEGTDSDSGSRTYKPARAFDVQGREGAESAGCVALISSGTASGESAFLDASETGGDVFFLTKDQLVPADLEGSLSVYDAHECTMQSPCPSESATPPPCETAEACRSASAPQPMLFGAGPSETLSGSGNPAPPPPPAGKTTTKTIKCPKGKKLSHGRCVKKRSKKKSKRAKKSDRRGRK